MTLDEMSEKARALMTKRFHCSQAVLAVAQEKLGQADPQVIRAMGAFGGGLGGNGEVCGAVAGGLAALGIRFSRASDEEKEDPRMWRYTDEFVKRFRDEVSPARGKIKCFEIVGVDWKNRDQVNEFYREKAKICATLVGDTARLIGELLERI